MRARSFPAVLGILAVGCSSGDQAVTGGHGGAGGATSSSGHGGASSSSSGAGAATSSSASAGGGSTTSSASSAASGSSSSSGGGPCAGQIGLFCGGSLGLPAGTLYSCNGDMPMVEKQCSAGCVVHGGGADACGCPSGDGLYCGQTVGADGTKLYDCAGGVLTPSKQCVGACTATPATCGACPSGNGLYCGSGINMDPKTLYNCNAGVLTVAQQCPSPCKVNPPGQADTCGACPSGNGAYCGATLGVDPNKLYNCNNGNLTVTQTCPSTCHVSPPGQADYCEGNGQLTCSSLQWWNTALTYGPYTLQNGAYTWWDTDLAVPANTPIQLRHDSKLVAAPVEAWGWQPQFIDQATGKRFQFLHLHPTAQYTTGVGTVYPAGTIVGLSGGNTGDTGYPTYSTGAHLCVETIDTWLASFPPGNDACH
jgi:hypothetical protein